MPEAQNKDPYAPPPMHHDRSGALVRVAILAGLLGAAAWGYVSFAGQEQTALVPEIAEEQQMADAGASAAPDTLPEATSESLPAAAPTPARRAPARRTAPAEQPAPEAAPPPPTATAPIPPVDVPPAE